MIELDAKAKEYLSEHWSCNVAEMSNQRTFQQVKGIPYFYENAIKQAYIAGAEPREKRIAELEEQNTSLLTSVENLNKSVQELEAQIEKMKCCSNCNHFNKESDIEYCQNCERQLVNSLDNFPREEIIKDEWELRR